MSIPKILLKPRRSKSASLRHPWIFAGDIQQIDGQPADGADVLVHTDKDAFVSYGLFNSKSKLSVRQFSWQPDQPLTDDFWRTALNRAIDYREALGLLGPQCATRLIFSEGDQLSGMIVDKFDQWLVIQFTSLAMANKRELFAQILRERLHPRGIYIRTEKGIGKLEGLVLHDGLLMGEKAGEVVIDELGVKFALDLEEGQKTGFYVDQRDNHFRVSELMKGRTVLDAFSYSGGFGLHCAKRGAAEVTSVDVSEAALDLARRNAALNDLQKMEFIKSDVFEYLNLAVHQGKRFSGIILDPPKFARTQKTVVVATQGYRKLLRNALKLLAPDGILVMCCCSGLISQLQLEELIGIAATETRRFVQIIERRGQAADHPVNANCLETSYLKCIICRVI